ncbi:MAG TPA: formyltransferase family protein [Noviherbaspirillum sp.]
MNILIVGQKRFAVDVFNALSELPNVKVVGVCAPPGDRLLRRAGLAGVPTLIAGTLCEAIMPEEIDLIVAAHSHDFIGERTRLRARFGGIGYHPSLLPLHRGRDAVKWAIRLRERVTGGTVYRLSQRVDGGNIIEQEHVFIRSDDTPAELWRRELGPLGVRLLSSAVSRFAQHGFINGIEQDEELATWEPALGTPPLFRPELLLIGHEASTRTKAGSTTLRRSEDGRISVLGTTVELGSPVMDKCIDFVVRESEMVRSGD